MSRDSRSDFLKNLIVNINNDNILEIPKNSFPDKTYQKYRTDKKFLSCFANVLHCAKDFIDENFEETSVTSYGRIKAIDSYERKRKAKDNIFDTYAFTLIVEDVSPDYKNDNKNIIELQNEIKRLKEELGSFPDKQKNEYLSKWNDLKQKKDKLCEIVADTLTKSLVSNDSSFLENSGLTYIEKRSKDIFKEKNGYRSRHETFFYEPLNCFIEVHICTRTEQEKNKSNYVGYKKDLYNYDINFPYDALESPETLEKYSKENLPTFVVETENDDKKEIDFSQMPCYVNLLEYFTDFLYKIEYDEKGNPFYTHQDILDRIYELASEYESKKVSKTSIGDDQR